MGYIYLELVLILYCSYLSITTGFLFAQYLHFMGTYATFFPTYLMEIFVLSFLANEAIFQSPTYFLLLVYVTLISATFQRHTFKTFSCVHFHLLLYRHSLKPLCMLCFIYTEWIKLWKIKELLHIAVSVLKIFWWCNQKRAEEILIHFFPQYVPPNIHSLCINYINFSS